MKKKIESELLILAEEILKGKGALSTRELKIRAQNLYEKLTILNFTEENLIGSDKVREQQREQQTEPLVDGEKASEENTIERDEYLPDGTEYNDSEAITEPNTEKIKDIVAQMPPESQKFDTMISQIIPKEKTDEPKVEKPEDEKKDFRDIGVDYDNLPDFEPLNNSGKDKDQRPKSLNDRLKKGINIGLNERLAFIRHLFEGNTSDYNRVLSQLNTFNSLEEAEKFIQKVVKPDYKHWEGKEAYEERFLELIKRKFSK